MARFFAIMKLFVKSFNGHLFVELNVNVNNTGKFFDVYIYDLSSCPNIVFYF